MSDRTYPMAKPDGFVPAVQRYSARFGPEVGHPVVLLIGAQSRSADDPELGAFLADVIDRSEGEHGPDLIDHARYVDEADHTTHVSMCYWADRHTYRSWWESPAVSRWWRDPDRLTGSAGYFAEPLPAAVEDLETIAFRQYTRGLAACPMSTVEPMGESGYWGAARDRIPSSGRKRFAAPDDQPLRRNTDAATAGRRLVVQPPENYCFIRSGVSWVECGPEQLNSYRSNVEPKLNTGMEFLRQHPIEAGCWSLRQVTMVDEAAVPLKESYVAGHFVSLAHLEEWAHNHPTHLAIYGQAQKERTKYQDDLELRTYHEVYVVESPAPFEYVNCHPDTGALGLLARS